MRVAIVGAGVAGLAGARALVAAGFDVVVFEEQEEVGGVWAAARRYPGLRTQNDGRTYAFSDLPMPLDPDLDPRPTGATVRGYLREFARRNGLEPRIRLGTRVVDAQYAEGGWVLEVESADGRGLERADRLVVANGLHRHPHVPDLPGAVEFAAAGGLVLPPSGLGDGQVLHDRDVVVVGYGKSAADVAVAALGAARSVTVVARRVAWKLPPAIGRLTLRRLVLSRVGEHLLWAPYRSTAGRVVRRLGRPVRTAVVRGLERRIVRALDLERLGLVPTEPLPFFTHLTTDGFYDAVRDGRIVVRTGVSVERLEVEGGRRVVLSDGRSQPADVVVVATGFDQDLGFLSEEVRRDLLDDDGALRLRLHTLPERQPALAFLGWTHSFRGPLSAEIQAAWLAAVLAGRVPRPAPGRRAHETTVYRLSHDAAAASGRAQVSTGASIPDLDRWLRQSGARVPRRVLLRQLFGAVDATDYAVPLRRVLARIARDRISDGQGSAPASPR